MLLTAVVLACILWYVAAQINTWETDNPPVGTQSLRQFHVAATLNSSMLVFGGVNLQQQVLGDTQIYDYVSNMWESVVADMNPPARLAPAYTTFNGSNALFMFGGLASLFC